MGVVEEGDLLLMPPHLYTHTLLVDNSVSVDVKGKQCKNLPALSDNFSPHLYPPILFHNTTSLHLTISAFPSPHLPTRLSSLISAV